MQFPAIERVYNNLAYATFYDAGLFFGFLKMAEHGNMELRHYI